jgi:hypothetical protein
VQRVCGENELSEWEELNGIIEVAEAVAAGMEIEVCVEDLWGMWGGETWYGNLQYRAHPNKPAKVQVKSLCWRHEKGALFWGDESTLQTGQGPALGFVRFPAGDIEGEVENG